MNKKFIMIGERNKKGRITKKENYEISEFFGKIFRAPMIRIIKLPIDFSKLTWLNMIFKREKVIEDLAKQITSKMYDLISDTTNTAHSDMLTKAVEMVNQNDFGKKKN